MSQEYGLCECGKPLSPVWYWEEERDDVYHIKTGRQRLACSYLVCDFCGKTYPVDGTFDKPWESRSKP